MSNTEAMRKAFEAEVKQSFDTNENSFRLDPSNGKYYGSVRTKTFGGLARANYEPVAMLFYFWQAATAQATAAERERTKPRMAVLESLLKQASSHLMAWATKYGNNNPSWLPPAHDVRLLETIDDWLRSAETIRKGEALEGGQ